MAYEPVLSPYLDMNPCPRVEVFFEAFAPGTVTVDVYQTVESRNREVRGAIKAATAGAFTRIDFEVPFGVPVSYWAEMFDASGVSLGVTGSASVTVWFDGMVVHNPLDPAGAMVVDFTGDAARSIDRPNDAQVVLPKGRRVGVLIGGDRYGVTDVVLNVVTDSLAAADRFQEMLGGYESRTVPVLCFRLGASHRVRLPRPFFAGIAGSVSEEDLSFAFGGETIVHALKGTEVAPPAPGIFIPLLTRADVSAYYATRGGASTDNDTRGGYNRRYDLAGFAS